MKHLQVMDAQCGTISGCFLLALMDKTPFVMRDVKLPTND